MSLKAKIREIITSWWSTPLPTIYSRTVDLTNYFDPKLRKILAITGFRRVGKTFTLLDFAQKHGVKNCIYLNFEDDRLPQNLETLSILSDVVRELMRNEPIIFLLDEIQEISLWSRWVRRMNETTANHLIISGSSSRLLASELPTELRGQTITIPLTPLTWDEYCHFNKINISTLPTPDILSHLRNFLTYGGLPEIVLAEPGLRPLILSDYYTSFIQHDLIDRHHIRKPDSLSDLLRLLPTTYTFTYSKLANTLKSLGYTTTKDTVIRYLSWIKEAYYTSTLTTYSSNLKTRLQSPQKNYLIDNYFNSFYGNFSSSNLGHLMEQTVYHHLVSQNLSLNYWKDFTAHEVDFVVSQNNQVSDLIQVSYAHNKQDIDLRELNSLITASARFPKAKLTLVTWEFADTLSFKNHNIHCIPLYQYLTP